MLCPNCEVAKPGGAVRIDSDLNCVTCGERFSDAKGRILASRLSLGQSMTALKEHFMDDHRPQVGDALEQFVEQPCRWDWGRGIFCATIGYLIGHFILWAYAGFPVAGR